MPTPFQKLQAIKTHRCETSITRISSHNCLSILLIVANVVSRMLVEHVIKQQSFDPIFLSPAAWKEHAHVL